MIRIVKWLLFACLLSAFSGPIARANTLNAPDCSLTSVQSTINSASSGDTVIVPAGSCTWSSQVEISGKGLTLIGATVCNGTPTTQTTSCADNTVITLTYGADNLVVTGTSASNFVELSGFTFIDRTPGESNGVIRFSGGMHGSVSFRIDHLHLMSNSGGVFLKLADSYGLVDHILADETGLSGMNPPFVIYGDGATRGYQNWNDPTAFGSNQAVYFENCTYNADTNSSTSQGRTEGFFDAYAGAKIVMRYNAVNNIGNTGGHGTDSGNWRSTALQEIYNNTLTNNVGHSLSPHNFRGGTELVFNNTFTGTSPYTIMSLGYFRISQVTDVGQWGSALSGLNWVPLSSDPTNFNSTVNTLNAPNWAASNSYATGVAVGPLGSSNPGNWNYQNRGSSCKSGAGEPSWNQTPGSTTNDGTCTWTNVGGATTPGLMTARWCAVNADTLAASNITCSSLAAGDTASRFFDSTNGTYPFRDQPGVGHNQASFPIYEWGNTGSQAPSEPMLTTDAPLAVQANRDYFDYTPSFNGSSGVGTGTLSARPSSCTAGVGYWATDTNTLYQCSSSGAWTPYYTPYTYPYPTTQTVNVPAPPTNVEATVTQ